MSPAQDEIHGEGTNKARERLLHFWQKRKVRIGTIILIAGAIASLVFYTLQPHPTYSPIPNTTYTGVLVFQDSLTTNDPLNNRKNRPFINFTSNHGFCRFTASGYLVGASEKALQSCIALGSNYSDFAMKIDMTIVKGSGDGDGGGIFFRANTQPFQYYSFYISALAGRVLSAVSPDGSSRTLIQDEAYLFDATQIRYTFPIEIIARGENIRVCVNNECYKDFPDGAYSQGGIGVFAQSEQGQTEVQFNAVEVWTL